MTSIRDTPEYRAAQAALESYCEDYWDRKLSPVMQEITNLRNEVEDLKRRLEERSSLH